jgi:mono/diheme cytochrome c family protein
MYGATELSSIEELIRRGAPRAWLEDPDVAERLASQHIRMPAYEDVLTDGEIDDLVAFVGVLERVGLADASSAGRELAREHGCLSCHGVEGAGGVPNPGSMGGFIPGFLGRNFTDLVKDEAEFREWVLEGTSRRLERNPVARFFWRRQKVQMPAYRGHLSDEDVGRLWDWVVSARASFR